MPITVAFWNLYRLGKSSGDAKLAGFTNWLGSYKPDVFAICEANKGGMDRLAEEAGYTVSGYVNTLSYSLKPTALCLGVMVRNGGPVNAKNVSCHTLRMPNADQIRAMMMVNVANQFRVMVIHARACRIGGCDAADLVIDRLITNQSDVAIGDFNYDLNPTVLHNLNQAMAQYGVKAYPPAQLLKTHQSGGMLDFLLAGSQRTITPLVSWDPNTDEKKSDHYPVLYSIA